VTKNVDDKFLRGLKC